MKASAAALLASGIVLATAAPAPAAGPEGPPERPDTHPVMFVGNNWDGTADIVDARTFKRLGRINTIPDREERTQEILANPAKAGFFLAIRQLVGEGNDQFTDDMFTSHDGRFVYVSRPSFADVVGIEIATGKIVWRFPMEGYRADHMAISPDGGSLLVSDSTGNKVHRLDTRTGRKTGEFASGDSPHENNYTRDGGRVFHASIGRVYTPTDRPELGPVRDSSKGARYFQINDGRSLALIKRWDMGQKLKEFGRPEMESAVRPMATACSSPTPPATRSTGSTPRRAARPASSRPATRRTRTTTRATGSGSSTRASAGSTRRAIGRSWARRATRARARATSRSTTRRA